MMSTSNSEKPSRGYRGSRRAWTLYVFAAFWVFGARPAFSAWSTPKSGWLYVLDPNESRPTAAVIVVDPTAGSVKGSIMTGPEPDLAVSPDGNRLYVTSGSAGEGVLSVIDAHTGTILQTVPVPYRIQYIISPVNPSIAVSPDSSRVYVETMRITSTGDVYGIATFDVGSGVLLPNEAAIPGCGIAQLTTQTPEPWDVQVKCESTNSVRLLKINNSGSTAHFKDVALPWRTKTIRGQKYRFDTILASQAIDGSLRALEGDGGISHFSANGADGGTRTVWDGQGRIIFGRMWATSSDGRLLYAGSVMPATTESDHGLATFVEVIDINSGVWRSISTSLPFWSTALSADGRFVYAVCPEAQSIIILDSATYREVGKISGVGANPAFAIRVP